MNWECILESCAVAGMNLIALFFTYRMGRDNGRHEGYLNALDDMEKEIANKEIEKIVIAIQKETKEG